MLSSLSVAPPCALLGWKTQPARLLGAGVTLSGKSVENQAKAPRVSHFGAGEARLR